MAKASEGTVNRLRNKLFGHIQHLPYSWHNQHQTGDIIQRCTMINVRELSIIGSRMSSGQFEPTIVKFEHKEFELEGMVSHYIPFDHIDQVFEHMQHPVKDMKKMVILFGDQT